MNQKLLPDVLNQPRQPVRMALIAGASVVVVAGLSFGGAALGLQPTSVTVSTTGTATPTSTPVTTATPTPTSEATVTDTPKPTVAPSAAPAPVVTPTAHAVPNPSLGNLNPIHTDAPVPVGPPIVNPHPGVPDPSLGFMATPTPKPAT